MCMFLVALFSFTHRTLWYTFVSEFVSEFDFMVEGTKTASENIFMRR